jgi:hypothetical protein
VTIKNFFQENLILSRSQVPRKCIFIVHYMKMKVCQHAAACGLCSRQITYPGPRNQIRSSLGKSIHSRYWKEA